MTGLLANYPRRFDLWSVFLDLEIKEDDTDSIRYTFPWILLIEDVCFKRFWR
jgi:hypothetical protein